MTGEPEIGETILGFELIEVLGSGSFGTVYLARQGNLADRPVVLKVTRAPDSEPRLLAQLQHTNIVPIYSFHRASTFQAACMPYLGRATLKNVCDSLRNQQSLPETGLALISSLRATRAERPSCLAVPARGSSFPDTAAVAGPEGVSETALEARTPPPREDSPPSSNTLKFLEGLTYVEAVLWIGSRLASGLAHAHDLAILHLDLKPANILLTDEGQPMLLDFNLSIDLKVRTGTLPIGGTALYMSPEQLQAYQGKPVTVDARSDIYSLGIILFELLTGRRPPYRAPADESSWAAALLEGRGSPPPRLRTWNRAVSPAVESIVRHCLEPDPARRYQSAVELQVDIERHLSHQSLRYAPEPSYLERAAKWTRRHPALCSSSTIAAVAIVFLAALGLAAWYMAADARRSRARLAQIEFHDRFEQCQLLLNTTHLDSQDHLLRGLTLARLAMAPFLDSSKQALRKPDPLADLPQRDRLELLGELAELIIMEVRGRLALAQREPSHEDRRRACAWGVERLQLASTIDPHPQGALYRDRGRLLALLGRDAESARDLEMAARIPPATARDHYLLGASLLAAGEADRAEMFLSRSLVQDPRRFWAWFALGLCHADQGRPDDAAYDFAACILRAPHLAWPYLNRALALSRCGRLTEALPCYDRAIELDPRLPEAFVNRGLVLLELGHPDRALEDLRWAVGLRARSAPVLSAQAEALSRLGRAAEAEAAFAEILAASPSDPALLVARGFSRIGRDLAGAARDFESALQLDARTARAYLGRAYLVRARDSPRALQEVERALAIDPDLVDALQLRALLRARLNDPRAELDVDRILRVPTPQRLYNAACVLALLCLPGTDSRRQSLALDHLERALKAGIDPGYAARDPDLESLRAHPLWPKLPGLAQLVPPR